MALAKTHFQRLEQLLMRLGLNKTEIHVYLTALKVGPNTVMNLAEHAELKRVTTHAVVNELITKSVFLDTYRGKKRLVYAAPIDALQTIVEQKRFEVEQLESQLESSKSLFQQIKSLSENFPDVRMYQWTEWITTTLLEIARDEEDVCIINDAHSFNELIEDKTLHWSYQKRTELWVKTRMVYPDWFKDYWHIEWDDNYAIHIKTLPVNQIVDGWISIRGNKVAMHCYKEWFITTTILENKEIAALVRCMFDAVWRGAADYQGSFVIV